MGFFFRRSGSFGPLRFNFSKSGIGASLGFKGARLTMTPRGTTYITIGSNGFYYRETLPIGKGHNRIKTPPPSSQKSSSFVDDDFVASATSINLEHSSCEQVIGNLNKRAKMYNPAWLFYLAAAFSLTGLFGLSPAPTLPNLPDTTSLSSADRLDNIIDEYALLAGRYGEPNSIRFIEASPQEVVAVGIAQYDRVHLNVSFVPIGCVPTYEQLAKRRAETGVVTAKKLTGVAPCKISPTRGWTIVGYADIGDNRAISFIDATARLRALPDKRKAPPAVQAVNSGPRVKPRSFRNTPSVVRPVMASNPEARIAAERLEGTIKDALMQTLLLRIAVTLACISLLIAGAVVHKKNTDKRQSHLLYALSEAEQKRYSSIQESIDLLAKCHHMWRIESKSSTSDWKRNAGASSFIQRIPIAATAIGPPRVTSNVIIPGLHLGSSQLYFLPDTILLLDEGGYGGISYDDFRIDQGFTRFVETGTVPADATIVDQTWSYVNRNGSPDLRFSNNRQLPVLQLGVLTLTYSKGLNIQINTSNAHQSVAFAQSWRRLSAKSFGTEDDRADHPTVNPPDPSTALAQERLGLNDDWSPAELSVAYHRLAQMYHPDKVAGLAPEFHVLAKRRMQEINAAYELLKRSGS